MLIQVELFQGPADGLVMNITSPDIRRILVPMSGSRRAEYKRVGTRFIYFRTEPDEYYNLMNIELE